MSDTHSDPTSTQNGGKPKKYLVLKIIIILFVLLGLTVAMLPMLLSGPFKGVIVSQINKQLNGNATIDKLSLSWFGAQKVAGFKIADQAGQMLLEIEKIDLPGVSLFGLATGNRDFGDVSVHINSLHVVQQTDGSNNLQTVVKSSDSSSSKSEASSSSASSNSSSQADAQSVSQMIPAGMAANVNLVMDQFTFEAPDQPVTQLADTRLDLSIKGGQPVVGKLASNLSQGALRGSVVSNLNIDQTVDMTDTQVTMDVTPDAWAQAATSSTAKLLEPFGIVLTINRLKLPALAGASGLNQLEADINMSVTDVKLESKEQTLGVLKLSGTTLQLNAMGEKEPVTLQIKGTVTQSNQDGRFDLNVNLQNLLSDLAANRTTLPNVKAKIAGQVQNVGLVIFDELFQTGGLIRNAIGPTLTANIDSQLQYDQASGLPRGNLDLKAQAQFVNADLSLKIDQDGISQAAPGRMNMQITPALYAVAMKVPADKPVLLTQPFMATVQFNKLSIPRTTETWQIQNAVIDLALNLEDVLLRSGEDQALKLAKPSWTLKSEKLGQKIELAGGFEATQAGGKPGAFTMSANALSLYDDKGDLNRDKAQFEANMTLLPWQLPRMLPMFKKLKFNINSLVNQVVGAKQTITLKGRMLPTDAGSSHPQVPNMQLTLSTSSIAINTNLAATIKNDLVVLDPQSTVNIKVTPELVALLTSTDKTNADTAVQTQPTDTTAATPAASSSITLAKPVTFKAEFTELAWPIDQSKMENAVVAMRVSFDQLEPAGLPGGLNASLRNTVLSLGKGNPSTSLPIRITGDMFESNAPAGKLDAKVLLRDLLKTPAASDLKLTMNDVPVALIDSLSGMQGKVFAVLGSRIDSFMVTANGPLDKDMQLDINAQSNVLQVAAKAKMQGQFLIVEPGSKINLKVTPDAIQKLQKSMQKGTGNTNSSSSKATSIDWQLTEPANLQFAIDKLVLPTGENPLSEAQFGLGFEAGKLSFVQNSTKLPLVISDLKMRVDASKLSTPLTANLTANMAGKDAQGKVYQSPLTSRTTITNLLDKDGKVDAVHATIKTDTQIPQLPIELIDSLTGQQGKLAGIIGPTADIKATGTYPGNLDLSLVGKFTTLSIPANIDAKRNLTLRQDAVVTLAVTPETAKTLLKYGNPILIDATSSRDPIKVTIFAKNFAMPLEGFDISKLAADMQLELGTITLADSWLLNSVNDGFGKLDRAFSVSSKQEAKFTNMSLSIRNGVTKTNDVWMQIDDVKLLGKSRIDTLTMGTQGSVDLVKSTANMKMAIPAQTLYSFGNSIRKYVSPDSVYELPMTGPLDSLNAGIQSHMKTFAAGIAASIAIQEQVSGSAGQFGPLLGNIGGGLAGKLAGGKDFEEYRSKSTWPNKPVIKEPQQTQQTQEQVQQQFEQTQQQQQQQLKDTKTEKKNDTQKALDALQNIFGR